MLTKLDTSIHNAFQRFCDWCYDTFGVQRHVLGHICLIIFMVSASIIITSHYRQGHYGFGTISLIIETFVSIGMYRAIGHIKNQGHSETLTMSFSTTFFTSNRKLFLFFCLFHAFTMVLFFLDSKPVKDMNDYSMIAWREAGVTMRDFALTCFAYLVAIKPKKKAKSKAKKMVESLSEALSPTPQLSPIALKRLDSQPQS